ncbi:LmeA family phospholipid-binding protein [Actinoplanes sp. NPDC051851]|uniref:LmeA family phospholipid-binding protein n=1 Tax=Actinoplanes sp. NPDC051851 TaxID=3154753 RepID=UPI003433FB4E
MPLTGSPLTGLLHRAGHAAGPRRRWMLWTAGGVTVLVALGAAAYALPLPFLNTLVADRIRAQVACPGTLTTSPKIMVDDDHLLSQAVRGSLDEIQLTVPDATLSGVPHATFTATLRDVSQPTDTTTHVGSMEASIAVDFTDMPSAEGSPAPTYQRSDDGGLLVDVTVPAEASDNVRAKLFLKMRISGTSAEAVPQELEIFGKKVAAAKAASLTGGVRKQSLPALPDGVTYRSITPRKDGLHVVLAGFGTEGLDTLPTEVGGRAVTYSAADGLLGIATAIEVEPIINVPLTILAAPKLDGTSLTMVPQAVHILGKDRDTDDFLSTIVLSQIDQKDLTRELPALPSGVTYRSVTVDEDGVHVTVGGTTVQPFSVLKQPEGRPTTFGAEDGLLTAVTTGSGKDTEIELVAQPKITGSTLDISPQEIEMFGTRFPAENVLSQVKTQQTSYPLQELPANLTYQGVDVTSTGLLIHLSGQDVTLTKGALTGGSC